MPDSTVPERTVPEPDFAGVVDEVRAAYKPNFADVTRRAARHRRHRAAIAAAVAAVTVGATGVAIRLGSGTDGLAGAPASWSPFAGSVIEMPSRPVIVAGDLNHLYLAYSEPACTAGACPTMLATSANRGATWRRGQIPLPPGNQFVELIALSPTTLLAWLAPATLPAPGTRTGSGYLASTDAGLTWRTSRISTVGAVPDGWRLLHSDSGGYPDTVDVLAADPATGDLVRLAPQPAVTAGALYTGPSTSAGIWITGNELLPVPSGSLPPESITHPGGTPRPVLRGRAIVAVSHDGGRTWQPHTFTGFDDGYDDDLPPLVATADGHTAYVLLTKGGTTTVYRTVDGGRDWASTGAALPGIAPGAGPVTATVRPDGTLMVRVAVPPGTGAASPTGIDEDDYVSSDGGRTFTRSLNGHADAVPVPGGYADSVPAQGVWLSSDRKHWTLVRLPATR